MASPYTVRVRYPREGERIPDQIKDATYSLEEINSSEYMGAYVHKPTGDDYEKLRLKDGRTAIVACSDVWVDDFRI